MELNGSQVRARVPEPAVEQDGVGARAEERGRGDGRVRVTSRSISPQWGSSRFRPPACTYAPWGCIVRVDELAKSRKRPTRNNLPPFPVIRDMVLVGDDESITETDEHPDDEKKVKVHHVTAQEVSPPASQPLSPPASQPLSLSASQPQAGPVCRQPISLYYPKPPCKTGVLHHGWREYHLIGKPPP